MIDRYSRPEMREIWSEENKLARWLDIELAACDAFAEIGLMPADAAARLRERASVNVERVQEIEAITRHDVAAFVQSIEEVVGAEDGRFIHFGLTSSDILDTAFALQLVQAGNILIEGLDALATAIRKRAVEHRHTVMVGRSHGIHAEPTTVGHVLAIWYDEVKRNRRRLVAAIETVSVGKLSGSVGTFTHVPPSVEERVCAQLGLRPAPASNQVIQRDRHAEYFCAMALIASSLEKFAVQVRHWQRTEVSEAEEFFHKGQKGSSSMPHKRNPVLSENVTGLARLVRGYVMPALENVALWHERDISHSSVERVAAPDATVTLDFAIHRLTGLIDKLVFYPDNMMRNLRKTRGLVFSQRVLMALIQAGVGRDTAYSLVQRNAMRAWEQELDFPALVREDDDIRANLSETDIEECFDLQHNLRHLDAIFARVFEEQGDDRPREHA
ncbi:MAG: adenylosuccinate lyase [Deltaproteobacteria bacterium]|nr:MAG: adenylosuccinate lyase [Deltaproteobacteria bacterium]